MNKKRKQRLSLIFLLLLGVGTTIGLSLMALEENINLFFTPSQIVAGDAPENTTFRIGGLVTVGSVNRSTSDLSVQFTLTDTSQSVPVSYTGILPDLFREGQGIVAMGKLTNGTFFAEQVLAKHDENYMPPEVASALEAAKKAAEKSDLKTTY
jgi:cytochrome c-type biogenesis protein CcmE